MMFLAPIYPSMFVFETESLNFVTTILLVCSTQQTQSDVIQIKR
jgi:hypothetical protein